MDERIMPNDFVLHKPSGEEWVVCGVNHNTGELIPCGYPFPSMANISDCELTERRHKVQTQEQKDALKKCGLESFINN